VAFQTTLTVRIYDSYSKTSLWDVIETDFERLTFSTGLNGGFKKASISVRRNLSQVWQYVAQENQSRGRMFGHVEILEEARLIWEGRIMQIGFDPSGTSERLDIEALGYWSSTRDQWYDDEDGGNTDWAAAGSSQFDDIVKEMLTKSCPDINSNQVNIESPAVDINGTEAFHARKYVQDHIVDSHYLTDGSGDQWFFAIWDERTPYMFERDISTLHWIVQRIDLGQSSIRQDATWWRNNVLPIVGSTEGTESTGLRPVGVPLRDITVTVATGTPTAQSQDERDRILTERNQVQQSQRFTIRGEVIDAVNGIFNTPKWRVRSGEVIRIADLVPADVSTIALDNLRTFYIMETEYDARTNTLTVTPDRARRTLSSILAKEITIEKA
jgi:hypothetical protein